MEEILKDKAQEAIRFGEWILEGDYMKACQKYYRKVGTDIFKTPAELYKQ